MTTRLRCCNNQTQNGLLLRADIHTLFDLGLLAVKTEDMTCVLAPQLLRTDYEEFRGISLRTPQVKSLMPGRSHLDFHRENSKVS